MGERQDTESHPVFLVLSKENNKEGETVLDHPGPGDIAPPLPGPVGVNLLPLHVGLDGHHLGKIIMSNDKKETKSSPWGAA